MKTALHIILLVITTNCCAQQLSGSWRIAYIRSTNENYAADSLTDVNSRIATFRTGIGVFEFSKKYASIYNFNGEPKMHKIKNRTLSDVYGMELIIESFNEDSVVLTFKNCLLYTSPSPRDS